ncbi:GL24967 [Drosophila persimilis]|uniref:GL24967 n=1 Tax=Drosophila persimilis TaxID=7234 RepID=B4GRD1_DROPE|nr:GL24967 [Drosophila persimilis]
MNRIDWGWDWGWGWNRFACRHRHRHRFNSDYKKLLSRGIGTVNGQSSIGYREPAVRERTAKQTTLNPRVNAPLQRRTVAVAIAVAAAAVAFQSKRIPFRFRVPLSEEHGVLPSPFHSV